VDTARRLDKGGGRMKKALRWVALALLLGGGTYWAALGAHRGWTQTSVAVKQIDDVTGLEGIVYRRQFVPGLDFLGATVLLAGVVAASSFLIPAKIAKSP
jgi:hypothetical protein